MTIVMAIYFVHNVFLYVSTPKISRRLDYDNTTTVTNKRNVLSIKGKVKSDTTNKKWKKER